jgi:hypothetical protein
MVGNGMHSISCWFKMGLGWFVDAYSNHSIKGVAMRNNLSLESQGGWLWVQRGSNLIIKRVSYGQPRVRYPGLQGGGSTTKLSGIMEVAMLGFDHVSLTRMWVDYSVI